MMVSGKYAHRLLVASMLISTLGIEAFAEEVTNGNDKPGVELYAVGVYEGNVRTEGVIHGPEVRVTIERPDQVVALALGSYAPVRWKVYVGAGTELGRVVLYGRQPERSQLLIDGERSSDFELNQDLPYAYQTVGAPFRKLVTELPLSVGLRKLDGFYGSYRPSEDGFRIDGKQAIRTELDPDYLAPLVRPEMVPDVLRPYLEAKVFEKTVLFTSDGFELDVDGVHHRYPISLDVPPVSWPMDATYDPEGKRLFGVSLGGEGFLYQYNIKSDTWSVLTGMDNIDASGILYDAASSRIVIGGVEHRDGVGIFLFDFDHGLLRLPFSLNAFPGFSDLYDVGNGPPATLVPVGIANDWVLMQSQPLHRHHAAERFTGSRSYLVDLAGGDVYLVSYRNNN